MEEILSFLPRVVLNLINGYYLPSNIHNILFTKKLDKTINQIHILASDRIMLLVTNKKCPNEVQVLSPSDGTILWSQDIPNKIILSLISPNSQDLFITNGIDDYVFHIQDTQLQLRVKNPDRSRRHVCKFFSMTDECFIEWRNNDTVVMWNYMLNTTTTYSLPNVLTYMTKYVSCDNNTLYVWNSNDILYLVDIYGHILNSIPIQGEILHLHIIQPNKLFIATRTRVVHESCDFYLLNKTPYDYYLILYNTSTNSVIERFKTNIVEDIYALGDNKYLLVSDMYESYNSPYAQWFNIYHVKEKIIFSHNVHMNKKWGDKFYYLGQLGNGDILSYENQTGPCITGSTQNIRKLPKCSNTTQYAQRNDFLFLAEGNTITMLM